MKFKYMITGILMMLLLSVNVQAASVSEEITEQILVETDEDALLEESNDEQFLEEMALDIETIDAVADADKEDRTNTSEVPSLEYRAHVSNIGWMDVVQTGMVGTVGRNLPMEALEISVNGSETLGIEYQAHVSNIGWMDVVSNGEMAGTTGRALAMEAIRMNLTGEMADSYDLYYRAHVTNLGWLGWAKEGESAGSQGYAYTLQAIEIVLLPAGSEAPADDTGKESFSAKLTIYHEAYVQKNKWMQKNNTSVIAGTTGKNLNLLALKLSTNNAYGIGIAYSAHVRNIGWMDYVSTGKTAGKIGNSYAIEALKIRLTGEQANRYDLYYRAHVANVGWLDWAKNDEIAGSFGLGYAMQAVEIRVVAKGSAAPGNTACTYVEKPKVLYAAMLGNTGWQKAVSNGGVAGTTSKNLPMRAFTVELPDMEKLSIKYRAHVSNIGWQSYVSDGKIAGTENTVNSIEAIQMKLAGAHAEYYDVWYRVHSANLGWLGWAKNGAKAGTASLSYDAQAIQIVVSLKGSGAPGSTSKAFVDTLEEKYLWPCPSSSYITSYFGYRSRPTAGASSYHKGIDIGASHGSTIVATKSGTVTASSYNSTNGYYVEITHSNGVKSLYLHMKRQAVSKGMKVSRGQTVGYVGSSGVATGPHLHFSIVVNGNYVNPLNYVSP